MGMGVAGENANHINLANAETNLQPLPTDQPTTSNAIQFPHQPILLKKLGPIGLSLNLAEVQKRLIKLPNPKPNETAPLIMHPERIQGKGIAEVSHVEKWNETLNSGKEMNIYVSQVSKPLGLA